MRLPLTKFDRIVLTNIIVALTLSPLCLLFLVRLGVYILNGCAFYSYRLIGKPETDRFFADSGVQLAQSDRDQFHYHHTVLFSQIKSKVGNILVKADALRITLNIDGASMDSKSHTHPSHSQTFRLLTSSLSLVVPVTHTT
jgi:hypothetical protein